MITSLVNGRGRIKGLQVCEAGAMHAFLWYKDDFRGWNAE